MNLLELAQETRERCGMQGAEGSPSTVVSQTGEMKRLVNWVIDAWVDVQRQHAWNFMVGDFSFNTVAGTYVYPEAQCGLEANTSLSIWLPDTFRYYLTSAGASGEQYMSEWDYDEFRDVYEFQLGQSGPPSEFAIRRKDRAILLGPNPDAVYTVRGQYRKAAERMAIADASEPTGLPEEFHLLIVHRARMKYAAYEAAPEVMEDARAEYKSMLAGAEYVLLDRPVAGRPLA